MAHATTSEIRGSLDLRASVQEASPAFVRDGNRRNKQEGPPLRTALPLSNRSPDLGLFAPPLNRRSPRSSRGTSSQGSAHAAIDNETLDHLLSVVNDEVKSRNALAILEGEIGRRVHSKN